MDSRKLADPRNVAETYVNIPHSVYVANGNVHITLGIERPAQGTSAGKDFRVDREVAVRLVMPADAALTMAEGIKASLSPIGQAPLNRPLQS